MQPNIAAILHLSDLHLGRNFTDVGTGLSDIERTIRSYWSRGGLLMQAHDAYIVASLRTNIRSAARLLQLPEDKFNLLVVTGDISTTADSEQRFAFAKHFLIGKVTHETTEIGLEFPGDSTFCVPGNHDKLNERTCQRYLSHFSDLPKPLPYVVERKFNGFRFVVYGIDSNLYEEGNVAKGHIGINTFAWLAAQKYVAEEDHAYPRAIRLLLLHHHPCDLNKFRRRTLKGWLVGRLSQLEESDRLLDLCRDWIDVIMHGHEHFPVVFRDDASHAIVVSAGTTSESHRENGRNSFFALVFDSGQVRISEFRWSGGAFRRKEESVWSL